MVGDDNDENALPFSGFMLLDLVKWIWLRQDTRILVLQPLYANYWSLD